jgi:hypothetical protein
MRNKFLGTGDPGYHPLCKIQVMHPFMIKPILWELGMLAGHELQIITEQDERLPWRLSSKSKATLLSSR